MTAKKIKRINYNFTIEVDLSDPSAMEAFKALGVAETYREAAQFLQMDAAQTAAAYIEDNVDSAPVRIIHSQGAAWS